MDTSMTAAYEEAVRVGERLLDLQVREFEHHQRIVDEMTRVAIASLAGMIAVLGIVSQQPLLDATHMFWSAVGTVLLVVTGLTILLFVNGGTWSGRWLELGPDPARVVDALRDAGPNRGVLLASIADQTPDYFGHNRDLLARLVRWRHVGFVAIVFGVVSFLGAFSYIVGVSIYA